uniref:Nudix hydrolase domain-containing protein n=2 Tax=Aureimonas frigidaquae TaxID=424757 RepID=A0A0P0Z4Z1_9HYPH|nr:hypothetical protein [Aureimonas frigidaquae]
MAAQAPRPRIAVHDAAALVLVDDSGSEPRLLMGRRASGHVFMADVTVFPGGRLDRGDLLLARHFTLPESAQARLCGATQARFSPRRAVALALAAIREAYEETGIMLGLPGPFRAPSPAWRAFEAAGLVPAPGMLVPIARAITPGGLPRRFDARFFAARADLLPEEARRPAPPSDELTRVRWYDRYELAAEPLADITQMILTTVRDRLAAGTLFDPTCPMPVLRRRAQGFHSILV